MGPQKIPTALPQQIFSAWWYDLWVQQAGQRFDDPGARQNRRFDELKAEIQGSSAEVRAVGEVPLPIKA